jgi:hypothetical protein
MLAIHGPVLETLVAVLRGVGLVIFAVIVMASFLLGTHFYLLNIGAYAALKQALNEWHQERIANTRLTKSREDKAKDRRLYIRFFGIFVMTCLGTIFLLLQLGSFMYWLHVLFWIVGVGCFASALLLATTLLSKARS